MSGEDLAYLDSEAAFLRTEECEKVGLTVLRKTDIVFVVLEFHVGCKVLMRSSISSATATVFFVPPSVSQKFRSVTTAENKLWAR